MRVSIITCSLNHGQFIEQTIASVLSQDWPDLEYVVVDGGSTDNTVDILKSYESRITWISEPDGGQSEAINKGLQIISGDIVGWLNSDDIYYSGTIAHVAEFFAANSSVEAIYGNADFIDISGNAYQTFPTEPWDPLLLPSNCFVCQPATFLRQTAVQRCGLLNTKLHYCMDYEYWLRLADLGVRFAHIDRKLAASRMYRENKTLRARPLRCTEINEMMIDRFGFVPDPWIYDYTDALMEQKGRAGGKPQRAYYERELRAMRYALHWNRRISPHMRDKIPSHMRSSGFLHWLPRGTWRRLLMLFGSNPECGRESASREAEISYTQDRLIDSGGGFPHRNRSG
jgi:glycosyltransferase involved in cell wall biosynthesis